MTIKEWKKYKETFLLFKEKGYLDNISSLHVAVENYAHKNPKFLPWHRMLLQHVESILQMLSKDPSMGIPYWDWSVDSQDPSRSSLFKEEYWGENGCFLLKFPKEHCLLRSSEIDPFYTEKDIKRLLTSKNTYDHFREILELVPHAIVHMNVGGVDGDMSMMFSTNDPLFWHHHSFIDYLWYQKQKKGMGREYKGDVKERLYPFNRSIQEVLDLEKCNIEYVKYKPVGMMMVDTKKATPLSEEYIKKHGYDMKKVRRYEKFMRGEEKKGIFRRILEYIRGR